jgi:hypothetical protein
VIWLEGLPTITWLQVQRLWVGGTIEIMPIVILRTESTVRFASSSNGQNAAASAGVFY